MYKARKKCLFPFAWDEYQTFGTYSNPDGAFMNIVTRDIAHPDVNEDESNMFMHD